MKRTAAVLGLSFVEGTKNDVLCYSILSWLPHINCVESKEQCPSEFYML